MEGSAKGGSLPGSKKPGFIIPPDATVVQALLDSHDRMIVLKSDGTLWREGAQGWDKKWEKIETP